MPQYQDGFDSDGFLFSEAEDLVPEFEKNSDGSLKLDANDDYVIREKDSPDGTFTIRFYKPRVEDSSPGSSAPMSWLRTAS